ncbi:hypothetical protein [Microbacterium sp.]|uniref:hypothetical protein n=1 Tax=Microbacterium sp. TaxID=51671 RepID=UPI0039E67834
MIPPHIDGFLDAALRLDAASFARIRATRAEETAAGRRDASRAPRLSAAEFSALDKRVRDVLRPRSEEFRGAPGGLRAAITVTEVAAQALWKPDVLTAAQYESFVAPFRAEGVAVPPRS